MSSRVFRSSTTFAALIIASALVACSRAPQDAQAPAADTASAVDESKVRTFRIGELQAMALRDGGLDFPNDGKTFAVGHPTEEVGALLSAEGLPSDTLSLNIQPLLVKSADKVLLFDTGAGANMGPAGGGLPESLSAAGAEPESVTDIFISHMHGDHIGGLLTSQGALAFPNATIHLGAADWEFLKGLGAETAQKYGIGRYTELIAAIEPKVAPFSPGAELVPGVVTAVDIKGHTPGHSGFRITSGESSLLYIGDTMHHYVVSVQKPNWTIAFDGEAPVAEASRREVLEQSAASAERIYAVHFPFPGVGRFERRDDVFVWVPEEL